MSDAEVDFVLERYDQTEPHLQRQIVAELISRLAEAKLLLIRKSEALAVFASPAMWEHEDVYEWLGDAEYRDPMAFAKREAEATEPDDRP